MKSIIVDSMTYDEIIELMRFDMALVNHKIKDGQKIFAKTAGSLRNRERKYYNPIEFKSSTGINYVVQFFNNGIETPRDKRLGCYYYGWYLKSNGIYCITCSLINREMWHFNIYTPHFFDRYRERFIEDNEIEKPDVIYDFFINNPKRVLRHYDKGKSEFDAIMFCNDGMCFGNVYPNFLSEVKTFVSWDLVKPDQLDCAKDAKEWAKQFGYELNIPEI